LGCVAFALGAGKDLNWDLINYHYYLGFSVFNDRFNQDFFPATVVSYATPYAYVPLYLMISGGIDDRLICVILAVIGSTALWAIWEIGGLLGVRENSAPRFSILQAYLGAILAAICPVFFIQVGTSYIDVTTAAVALFGYLFLVRFVLKRARRELVFAAVLLGMSVGLKQTNAIYALAGVFLVLAAGSPRASNVGIYSVAGFLGGIAVMAPWGVKLYREFGNPLFPNLNSFFKSPDFDTSPLSPHYRFIPDTLLDALLRPIWMMSPENGVYTEPPAPDARFFFLTALLLIVCVLMIFRTRNNLEAGKDSQPSLGSAPFWGLIASFVFSWCLWLTISGNGRYFMPMALLVGPLLVACVYFVGTGRRWVTYSISAVFVGSISLAVMGSAIRHHPSPWSGSYFDVEVPASLVDRPNTIFSLDTQPAAFIVPFLHPQSRFVSLVGIHVLGPGRPGWQRAELLLSRGEPPKFLLPARTDANGEMIPPQRDYLDSLTARIGFRVDNERCEKIIVKGLFTTSDIVSRSSDGIPQLHITDSPKTLFAVCPGRPDEALRMLYVSESPKIDRVFDAVERRCPALFPGAAVTEGLRENWRRTYPATDATLYYNNKKIRYRRFGQNMPRVIGDPTRIEAGDFEVDCTRKRDPLLTLDDVIALP
jgi:hypothetical protein